MIAGLVLAFSLSTLPVAPAALQGKAPVPNNRIKTWPNGSALTREEKQIENAARNTGLKDKDSLKASDTKPAEFILANRETFRVKEKSKVLLTKLPPEKITANEAYDINVNVTQGTMLVRGSKAFRGKSRFTIPVKDASVSFSINGTAFAVKNDGGSTEIIVAEGLIEATNDADPTQKIEIRHGQKAAFGGVFPFRARQITVEDLALYREILQLEASAAESDLRNDIADADISELYTKRWDPNGRWMAKPWIVPQAYDDTFVPSLLNVVRYARPQGSAQPEDKFFSVDETAKRVDFPDGWHMQALTADGKTILATHPEKGLWAYDFAGVAPPQLVSAKPLQVLSVSPDGKRLVARVGYPVKDRKYDNNSQTRGDVIHIGIDGKNEYSLTRKEPGSFAWFKTAHWFEGGKRLIAEFSGTDAHFIDGDSQALRAIYEGEGDLAPLGRYIFARGFQSTTDFEYIVTRTSDGKQWTGRVNKPEIYPLGGKWGAEDSVYFVNKTQALRLSDPPVVFTPTALDNAIRYKRPPLCFSPDGKFFAYVEVETQRLIIGDAKQPQRIFDTGVILYIETELTWLPVGDTIYYKSLAKIQHGWEPGKTYQNEELTRTDIAGYVELGAIKHPGHPEFTANPRTDNPAITLVGPPSLHADGSSFSSSGEIFGSLKFDGGDSFRWNEQDGISFVYDPSLGMESWGWGGNSKGHSIGWLNGRLAIRTSTETILLPENTSPVSRGLNDKDQALVQVRMPVTAPAASLQANIQDQDQEEPKTVTRAGLYEVATRKLTILGNPENNTEPLAINNKGEILFMDRTELKVYFRDAAGLISEVVYDRGQPKYIYVEAYLNDDSTILLQDNNTDGFFLGKAKTKLQPVKLPEGFYGQPIALNNRDQMLIWVWKQNMLLDSDLLIISKSGEIFSLRSHWDTPILGNAFEMEFRAYDLSDEGKIDMFIGSNFNEMQGRVLFVFDPAKVAKPGWAPKGLPTWMDQVPIAKAAPGFRFVTSSPLMESGVRNIYNKLNVLIMHPVSDKLPAVIERDATISADASTLAFSVKSYQNEAQADWVLGVSVDGKDILNSVINSPQNWQPIRVDLKAYVGKKVKLRIEARPGGRNPWMYEAGYLHAIRLTNDPEGTEPGESLGPNLVAGPADKTLHFYVNGNGQGSSATDGDGIRVTSSSKAKNPYNVGLYALIPDLKEGAMYEIRFQARADRDLAIGVWAQANGEPFTNFGLLANDVALQKDWRYYYYRFTAKNVRNPARVPTFVFGHAVGTAWIRDVSVREVKSESPG